MSDTDPKVETFYKDIPTDEARLHRLVTLRIRNAITVLAYYNKGEKEDSGLFDIVHPEEEADLLIGDLRLFGFLPPPERPAGTTLKKEE
jgi:hypothetical protein